MRVQLTRGESLLEALRRMGAKIEAPCNGNGSCGLCQAMVYGYGKVKTCQFTKPGIYEVKLLENEKMTAVGVATGKVRPMGDFVAVDLGTTTVALMGACAGNLWEDSFVNPQRVYGADVMSRIQAAMEGHEKELQTMMVKKLASTIRNNNDSQVCGAGSVIFAGNTTMFHLLRGMSVKGLGKAPFETVDLSLWESDRGKIDAYTGHEMPKLTFLPGISAFVGADVVSGIFATGMLEEEEPVLFLDLGTNGEMALGNRNKLLVTSAAAGPAFEGNEVAMKLHASGLLASLHELLDQGIMGDTGLLMEPYFSQGFEVDSEDGLCISQDLIREIQMAKAAIRAGIEILFKEYGITSSQVKKVYLAGGMGYYISPEDAVAIGLLPEELKSRCYAVGNASLEGAILYGNDEEKGKERVLEIVEKAEEIVLANHKDFESTYIKYMNFS